MRSHSVLSSSSLRSELQRGNTAGLGPGLFSNNMMQDSEQGKRTEDDVIEDKGLSSLNFMTIESATSSHIFDPCLTSDFHNSLSSALLSIPEHR